MNDITPISVADKMANMVTDFRKSKKYFVLDPSAGTGVLLDAVRRKFGNPHNNYFSVEIDPKRSFTLRSKDYIHFDGDILTKTLPKSFNLIVCNPPYYDENNMDVCIEHFMFYHNHLLARKGEMIGILNPEITNRATTTRQHFMQWLTKKSYFKYQVLSNIEVGCSEKDTCKKPMGLFYYRNG